MTSPEVHFLEVGEGRTLRFIIKEKPYFAGADICKYLCGGRTTRKASAATEAMRPFADTHTFTRVPAAVWPADVILSDHFLPFVSENSHYASLKATAQKAFDDMHIPKKAVVMESTGIDLKTMEETFVEKEPEAPATHAQLWCKSFRCDPAASECRVFC